MYSVSGTALCYHSKRENNQKRLKNSVYNIHLIILIPPVIFCEWNIVVFEETKHVCCFTVSDCPLHFCAVLFL